MTKQVIFYTKGLRYEVGVEGDKTFLLGATEKAQVYLQQQDRPIQLKSDGEEVFYQYGEAVGLLKDGLALGDTVFYLRLSRYIQMKYGFMALLRLVVS